MRSFNALIQRLQSQTCADEGEQITLQSGETPKVFFKKIEGTPENAPAGPGVNAANPDRQTVIIAAGDIAALPPIGSTLTRRGVSYTILDTDFAQENNIPVTYYLQVALTPVEGASADDAEQAAEFEYVPPA